MRKFKTLYTSTNNRDDILEVLEGSGVSAYKVWESLVQQPNDISIIQVKETIDKICLFENEAKLKGITLNKKYTMLMKAKSSGGLFALR